MWEEYLEVFIPKFVYYPFKKKFHSFTKSHLRKCIIRSNQTITPTSKSYDYLASITEDTNKLNIISNGIDLDIFDYKLVDINELLNLRNKFGITSQDFLCVYVGRISKEKNIDVIISAFSKIEESNIKLIVVGDGVHLADLKTLAKQYNIEDKVVFTGFIDHSDLGSYYQLGDVFVSSSTSETQGLTFLESLAGGIPVLAKPDKAYDQIIQDGYNGYYFNTEDELKTKIIELQKDQELLKKLKENAYESSKKYGHEIFASKVLEVYQKAIEGNKK
jgi:1,2-diacylglycerol 3-alpha-glucosyltransferase